MTVDVGIESRIGSQFEVARDLPIGARVRVVLQVLHGDTWQSILDVFLGTKVGLGNQQLTAEQNDRFIAVMPDEPLPIGDEYASRYPQAIDCRAQTVTHERLGKLTLRRAVLPQHEVLQGILPEA